MDLKSMSPYQLHELIKDAQAELVQRDKITNIQMRIDPKPRYIKPGVTGKGLNKKEKEKDSRSELEKLNAQIAACEAEIARLSKT